MRRNAIAALRSLHGLRKTLGKRFENNGPRKVEAETVPQPA